MTIYVKDGGVWREPKEVFVKDGGAWRTVKELHVNYSGTWRQVMPVTVSNQTYSTAGTSSLVVPQGVYTITVNTMSGGGGGGAAGYHSGDCHCGKGGDAASYFTNQTISVTPGETLTIEVGDGGAGGIYQCFQCSTIPGVTGGTSYIKRGATVLKSTAGGAGTNSQLAYCNSNASWQAGGTNGTGYGSGGTGGACANNGSKGGVGVVILSWG